MYSKLRNALLVTLLLSFFSCEREPVFDHLVLTGHEKLRTYSSTLVSSNLTALESVYPEISSLSDRSEHDIALYKISYKTNFLGEEITASGLVSIPGEPGSYPLISFQNGTNTCHSNAPSVNYTNPLYSMLCYSASTGYIIAIPDYVGFGESEEFLHLYYDRESSNRIIRDMMRAVKELTDYTENVSCNGDLYLMGYSQGGWATMSVLKDIEENPVEGFNLKAASCGAGAYDLISFTHYLLEQDTYPNPFYLPYYIESRRRNGILNEPLSIYFNEPYASQIPLLFDGSLCNSELNSNFTNILTDLLNVNLISGFDTEDDYESLRYELNESSVMPWHINTALMITHSNGDLSVPFEQSLNMYNSLIDEGSSEENIDFIELEGLLHNDAIIPWGISTLVWFQ